MRTATLTALAIAIFTVCAPRGARADSTADVLALIGQTADQICGSVAQSGHTTKTEIKGDVDASLSLLVKKLANLGIKGAGQINSTDYQGVLQDQLAATLGDIRECKLKVFDSLQQKLLSGAPDGASGALTEQLRVAQQRMEMGIHQCRADAEVIRADIGGNGSSYSYAMALDQVDEDTLAYLRAGEGQTFVDEFVRLRTQSGKGQGEYGILAGTVKGIGEILGPQLEQRDYFRKTYYPPTVAQAIEAPIRREQTQIATARAREGPLGKEILATYTRACDVLAQLNTLMVKRLAALPQQGN